MQISYAILTHNEGECIERLFQTILEYKDPQDEIVVVDDYSTDELTLQILTDYSKNKHIKLYKNPLNNNFANQKNYLSSKCSGDFIFNIDADEMVKPELIVNLKAIISANPDVDLYAIPRENTVIGITPEHIAKWNWRLNENGFVNFPDNQLRIMKRNSYIIWQNAVHEVPTGFKKFAFIPDEYALEHVKSIAKQEQQNSFYDTI
jgi:glycosyltransferase involved in cell wall biosynthesis